MTDDTLVRDEPTEDDLVDDAWLQSTKKKSRARTWLLVGLAAAVVFLGGVVVQRELGSTPSGSAASPAALPGGGQLPEGLSAGQLPGGGQLPDGGEVPGGSLGSGESPSADGTADTSAATADTVIGKISRIRGDDWVITDLGGERHPARIADDATLTAPYGAAGGVRVGSTVTVAGSTVSGVLTVHSITVR